MNHPRPHPILFPGGILRNFRAGLATVPALFATLAGAVELDLRGVRSLEEKELRESLEPQIGDIDEFGLSPASADDAAFFLRLQYLKAGYPEAKVDWRIAGPDRLALEVDEGPQAILESIRFHGNKGINDEDLRALIESITRERLEVRGDALPFVELDVEQGMQRIRGAYRTRGYKDAEIADPTYTFSPDRRRVTVDVRIYEGDSYRFAQPQFRGDLLYYRNKELMEELSPFLEAPYNPSNVANIERAIAYFYKRRGYYEVEVEVESHPDRPRDHLIPLEVEIQTGPVFRFDGIRVSGLDRLSEKFLPRRFRSLRGEIYDPEKLETIHRDLMQTGLFKTLRVESKPTPANEVALEIEVEESKARELGFSAGFGTFEGIILGIEAADRNLFGTGRPLSFSAEFAQRFVRGELVYSDPWFLRDTVRMKVKLYGLQLRYEGYEKRELGGRIDLTRKLAKHLEVGTQLTTRRVDTTSTGIEPGEMGPRVYSITSGGGYATLDLRNSPVNPTRGFVANAAVEAAPAFAGTESALVRSTVRFSYYQPIGETLLAFGLRGGMLAPGAESLPIDERFFNGGSRSVRSFTERDLGPKDSNGYPIGGDTFTTFNTEFVFPVFGDLDGALFLDAGSVGRGGPGRMRFGIGAGLRYNLPIGPIRLDYGWNPSPIRSEDPGAVHLSVGFAF